MDREKYILEQVKKFVKHITWETKFYVNYNNNQTHCFEDDIVAADNFSKQVNGTIIYEHQGKRELYKQEPYGGLWGMFNKQYEIESNNKPEPLV